MTIHSEDDHFNMKKVNIGSSSSVTSITILFIEKGFEIVYPEDITTFKEQIELFNSCSTLVALSGSGLTSLILMQENQKVVEILTEVMVGYTMSDDNTKVIKYGIHDHYRYMALLKNHTYIDVLNSEKQAELVKAKLDNIEL
jgi:capsular polysaccharide biosynthesis protein